MTDDARTRRLREPLAIDLFCGLGGWTEGLLSAGYRVVGFDNERHIYGEARYPAQLVIQDVLTLHGRQFKDAALIVASPPCQAYSYRAMPWKRAKALPPPSNELFDACFRIREEAEDATGRACHACGGEAVTRGGCRCECCDGRGYMFRHIPLVVENVRGAQPYVGRAKWRFGSFYLWGDVPALMPITRRIERVSFGSGVQGGDTRDYRGNAGSDQQHARSTFDGIKQGGDWFNASQPSISRMCGSKSTARKAASAHIAKIPYELARHIARAWKPLEQTA